jgi:predicted RNA polymerase sigma factor
LEALQAISDADRLRGYPFYPAALGDVELRRGNLGSARTLFQSAVDLARNDVERRFLQKRVRECDDIMTETAARRD